MPIREGEAQVFILAGMGGILIKDILENGLSKAEKAKILILQPMNAPEILREWLIRNGFDIVDEEMMNEGEKIYVIISAKWTGEVDEVDSFYYHIGRKLIEKRDPLLSRYIRRRMAMLKKALKEMEESDEKVESTRQKYTWLLEKMREVIKAIDN